jgi:outer membrane protein OmpA-like peptidoglycan-associated protein
MRAITARRVFIIFFILLCMSLMAGCTGMKKVSAERFPGYYLYYPAVLVDADQTLNEARAAGKDRACPNEYNEAKARVDRAYEEYMACKTPGPIPIQIACLPPACELKADKKTINYGDSVTLTMTTSGGVTSAMLDGAEVGTKGGEKTLTLASSETFTAKVAGASGSNTCSVSVTVVPPAAPTCILKADPGKINLGDSITLTMTTSGRVASAVLDGTEVALSGGTKKIAPTSARKFTAKVAGPGGSNTCSAPVSVGLTLYVHFPFDRPKENDDVVKWFKNTDAVNPSDSLDPANKDKVKSSFVNSQLKENVAELTKAVDFIKQSPDNDIKVIGHTDIKGTDEHNQPLSERRAKAVTEYIVDQHATDREKIKETKGVGSREPIGECKQKMDNGNDNPECRAKNRRVEIISVPR